MHFLSLLLLWSGLGFLSLLSNVSRRVGREKKITIIIKNSPVSAISSSHVICAVAVV